MKSFKRLIVSVVALSLTISLTGCGIIRQMMSILNGDYSEEPSQSEPTTHEEVTGVIGKDGGVIEDEESNVRISIPQGALQEDTNISAQYVEEPATISNNVQTGFLGAVTFGPSGTTFDKPVEVSVQLIEEPKNSSLSVFCYNESEKLWEYVTEASVVNISVAKFEITHFSTYQVVDRTRDFLNEYQNIVRHAKVNGLSDAEIIEEFRDYLVRDKHIMDYYEKFDGYWYEPCGLKLSGQYQINGEQNDPNHSFISEGESNKVGDTYGLCKIDGATSSKSAMHNASSTSEIFDVCVIVEYKMIKPDIELTASKKKLKKGETATISIRCHYTNVANFFDEFKDLELANYMLTIAKPTHFSTDKSVVLTNGSGRASFIVTALESNKAETITVSFDVSGPFGVHAEGNITLNSEGYTFEGHIEEELEFRYLYPETEEEGGILEEEGIFKIMIEYDIDGSFTEKDGDLTGSITISNTVVSFANQELHYYGFAEGKRVDLYTNVFDPTGTVNTTNPTLKMGGSVFSNMCDPTIEDIETLATTSGNFNSRESLNGENYDTVYTAGDVIVKNSASSLLPFELTVGEHVYEEDSALDTILFSNNYGTVDIRSYINFLNNTLSAIDGSTVEKTTQTITVTSGIQQE